MRVAVLLPGYGIVLRGAEIHVQYMIDSVMRIRPDWEFDIYCRASSTERKNGVKLIHVSRVVSRNSFLARLYAKVGHHLRYEFRMTFHLECLSFALSVAGMLRRERYDCVFNQAGYFAERMLGRMRKNGAPFFHATAGGFGREEVYCCLWHPAMVVCTSPQVKEQIEGALTARKVPESDQPELVVIPNGVSLDRFRPMERDAGDHHHPVVLFVGAMEQMKRPELTIKAVAKLDGVRLKMIGEGAISRDVEQLGKRLLGERFTYAGRVPNENLPAEYSNADVFTLASEEPFGIVFLEAMACNVPVVAHELPQTRWILGSAGITCDCTDISAYAGAIEEALNHDFGDAPRRRSIDFDWHNVAAQYVEAIEKVTQSNA